MIPQLCFGNYVLYAAIKVLQALHTKSKVCMHLLRQMFEAGRLYTVYGCTSSPEDALLWLMSILNSYAIMTKLTVAAYHLTIFPTSCAMLKTVAFTHISST